MKKRILAAVMAAAVFFSTAGSGINVNAAEERSVTSGTTYYVSTLRGKDTNDGKSEKAPFYSLRKINELKLEPGDKILLECGSVFKNGYLHLFGQSGSKEAPIVIDQYGTGADPIIDTNGQGVWYQNYGKRLDNTWHKYQGYVSSSILLYDSEYIEISNLEIVNKAPSIDTVYNAADTMDRTGVAAVAQDAGTIDHIHLKGLNIHDVIGNVYDKHMNNGGIYFTVYEPHNEEETGISRYDDVLIEDCSVIHTNRWGIAVGYTTKWDRFSDKSAISDDDIAQYGSTNVIIRNNYVKDAGGDGITLMYCDRPLIEYNVSDGIGQQMHSGDYTTGTQRFSAAIWPWKCKDAVFQYNEAFDTKNINDENGDGQAWDADWGDGTLYQYNYSHGNGGGCLMVCLGEAYRTTFRYNISQGDLKGILSIFGCPPAHIYNNVFYVEGDVPINREDKSGSAATLENNIFYYAGDEPGTDNSWNQGNSKTYSNNLYYNYANTPNDPAGVIVEKGTQVFKNPGSAPTSTTGVINLHENPKGKSVFNGYRLADNSPAIGMGKVITDMHGMDPCEKDFFGNTISSDEIPDIGVQKYQEKDAEYLDAEQKMQEAVTAIKAIINAGKGNYTEESWNVLLAAYDKISALQEDDSLEAVQDLLSMLNGAMKGLSEKVSVTKLAAPAVSGVKAVAQKDGVKVQITLNKVDNASSYTVYRTVGGKTVIAGTTTGTVFLDSTLYGGKQVTYSASAVSADTAKFTDSDAGEAKSIKLAKAPGNYKAKQKAKKAVLTWKKVKKAKSYIVYRSDKKNGVYKKIGTVKKSKATYTDKKVKKKKTYYYKVAAKVGSSYTVMTAAKKVKIK